MEMGTSGHFAALLSLGAFGAGCLAMGEKLIPIVPSVAMCTASGANSLISRVRALR